MIYLDRKSEEFAAWLVAHKPKPLTPKQRQRVQPRKMPREFLEHEVAQHYLRDKEVHTGEDLGAKPLDLDFRKITTAPASMLPANDASPFDWARRVRDDYVQDESVKCVTLWRAVVEQQAFDILKMWGASKEDHRSARMFFEAPGEKWKEVREGVCAMALIEPDQLIAAHRSGRLKVFADEAIGRDRWKTRMVNAQDHAEQRDLFYSIGVR